MACYVSRTYEERRTIQRLWEVGAQAKEIADKLEAPLSSIYSELRRGQDGSRLANQRLRYNAYPSVLAPGEKGYMYEETSLEDYGGDGNLKILPRPDIERATVDLIRYNVLEFSISEQYGRIKALGRIENTTNEIAGGMIYIVAVLV